MRIKYIETAQFMHIHGRTEWARTIRPPTHTSRTRTSVQLCFAARWYDPGHSQHVHIYFVLYIYIFSTLFWNSMCLRKFVCLPPRKETKDKVQPFATVAQRYHVTLRTRWDVSSNPGQRNFMFYYYFLINIYIYI